MSSVAATSSVSGWEVPTATTSDLETAQGAQQVFLQLLVAQLKNQNPMNPADGMEFVSQLTQFSELEQLLGMRQDLSAIAGAFTETETGTGTGSGDAASGSTGAA